MMNDVAFLQKLYDLNLQFSKMQNFSNEDLLPFDKLYREALVDSPYRLRNIKVFIDNLDIILKYANFSNIGWLRDRNIINDKDFITNFIKNIPCVRNSSLLRKMILYISNYSCDCCLMSNMEVLNYITSFDDFEYYWIYYMECMDYNERISLLRIILNKNIKLDFYNDANIDLEDIKPFIKCHIHEFINLCGDLLSLRRFLDGDGQFVREINESLNNNFDKQMNSLFDFKNLYKDSDVNSFKEFVKLIMKDIMINENVDWSGIDVNYEGSSNFVFFIGDKVFKISGGRKTERFANNPYILKPLLRRRINFGEMSVFFEVTESALNIKVSVEDLYNLYRGFRELGLLWTDVSFNNVGRLKKDNLVYWRRFLNLTDEMLGLDPYRGEGILLYAGMPIVTDADFIFDANLRADLLDMNGEAFVYSLPFIVQMFEKRYQDEKLILKR